MNHEIVLVGGGLQSALIALATLAKRPATRIAIVERDARLGGNHLWSFHEGDVPVIARDVVAPLVVHSWSGWQVAFPSFTRSFDIPYASITSEQLDRVVRNRVEALTHSTATKVEEHAVHLSDGRVIHGDLVIDARGPEPTAFPGCGFQKFVGLELSLRTPIASTRPTLMDATVPQTDGYRFFYVLPFARDRVLVEDTYFSDTATLGDVDRGILEHAERIGLDVDGVIRREQGVLPLPLTMRFAPTAPLVAGYRGGFFHPTTGYSFPIALRLALHIAESFPHVFNDAFRTLCERHDRQLRFALLLNRLLFGATPPQHRVDVMERFHHLPEATVRRFYALETTASDRARVVCGRPPRGISLRAALSQMVAQMVSA
jgi:lycopene beta-cyclase